MKNRKGINQLILIILHLFLVNNILACGNPSIIRLQNIAEIEPLDNETIITKITKEQEELKVCAKENFIISSENTTIHKLTNTQYLVEIICFLGAYQGSYQFFQYSIDEGNHSINSLIFTTFEEKENGLMITQTNLLTGYPDFNLETQQLTVDRKARGLGDCGSQGLYQWQDSHFDLVEYRYKGECDGIYIPIEEYPIIYP